MDFDFSQIDILLPNYLSTIDKGRLIEGLKQFKETKNISANFFLNKNNDYFLQSDILTEIRYPIWNVSNSNYEKKYCDAIIISTTCDIEFDSKKRFINKEILFAPLVEYDIFISELQENKIDATKISDTLKKQEYSNLFYLPKNNQNHKEYIALLDQLFWFPSKELNSYTPDISSNRILSLDYFGFYLFILKLSYHLCRLPEDQHRT
ncbi:MAG: hypothetical protein AABZ74_09105 [Cyanobacteriota bacterium]